MPHNENDVRVRIPDVDHYVSQVNQPTDTTDDDSQGAVGLPPPGFFRGIGNLTNAISVSGLGDFLRDRAGDEGVTVFSGISGARASLVQLAMQGTRRKMEAHYRRLLQEAILDNTTTRTGTLYNSPIITSKAVNRGQGLNLVPNFPATKYFARRSGQYAFVVNASVRRKTGAGFIAQANAKFRASPRTRDIISENVRLNLIRIAGRNQKILNQISRGSRILGFFRRAV